MMIGIICALSLAAGVGLCQMTGAFESFWWLLWMPVGFFGGFILCLILAFLILLLVCKCIDPDAVFEEDSPWFRWMILSYIRTILTILPVRIETRGTEKVPRDGRFLLVCNHLHNIDPGIVLNSLPRKLQVSFVAKREARDMFLLQNVLPRLMCPYINRENDRETLKTILRCISLLKQDKLSIGIFPEGRINKYRKLAHFRPGVFKIAQKANVPVVVCTLQNTQDVLANVKKLKSSFVKFHVLDVIPVEQLQGVTTVEIADRVYKMMAEDLGPENVLTPEEEENA